MHSTTNALPRRGLIGPVSGVGRFVLAVPSYMGGVTLMVCASAVSAFRRRGEEISGFPGFWRTLMHQLFWMLLLGFPLVGLVHIAMGSFLSLQAYYGSTFVDGTGAVVGVGLLRNLGNLMTGMTLSGVLAARMIPELRLLARHRMSGDGIVRAIDRDAGAINRWRFPNPESWSGAVDSVAPRIVAAAIACLFLSQWGIAVGTFVGWQASQSMMGLPTETFFMMLVKMMWFRDVVGLVVKGLLFGALPAAICCYEGLGPVALENELAEADFSPDHPGHGLRLRLRPLFFGPHAFRSWPS